MNFQISALSPTGTSTPFPYTDDDIIKNRLQSEEKAFRRCMNKYLALRNILSQQAQRRIDQEPVLIDTDDSIDHHHHGQQPHSVGVSEPSDRSIRQKIEEEFQFELLSFQHILLKHSHIQLSTQQNLARVEEESRQAEHKLTSLNAEIEQLQRDLDMAREEQKRKIEYDKLAREIVKLPSTKDTLKQIAAADMEIQRLEQLQAKQKEYSAFRKEQLNQLVSQMQLLGAQFAERKIDESVILGQQISDDFDVRTTVTQHSVEIESLPNIDVDDGLSRSETSAPDEILSEHGQTQAESSTMDLS